LEIDLPLIAIKSETHDTKSFKFGVEGTQFSYAPGQFVDVFLDVEDDYGNGVRSFSLSSSPTEKRFIMITTKIRPQSVFKRKLDSLSIGTTVKINGPGGVFTLNNAVSDPVVLLGGGIGITPFRSMMRHNADQVIERSVTLLYSNRTPEDIVFRGEWTELTKRNPNLKVIHTVTRPEDSGETWSGHVGRIDEALIKENIPDMERSTFYICGPAMMIEAMSSTLLSIGIEKKRIKIEEFEGY
jgi:ferredoxin-NADP reductase